MKKFDKTAKFNPFSNIKGNIQSIKKQIFLYACHN